MILFYGVICFRTATARGKADQADESADQAKEDCDIALTTAKQFAPDFKHPGLDRVGLREKYRQKHYEAQVTLPVAQESEKILDGKSIPNHIPPMHSQLPQANKIPNAMPSRRPSTQYPKTVQSIDPRLAGSPNFNTDDRNLGPPYDPYYNPSQDSWASTNAQPQIPESQKPYSPTEQMNVYGPGPPGGPQQPPGAYPMNRQNAMQYQQSMDQSCQQYSNQNRRLSGAVRSQPNQRTAPPQDWNPLQRRQSVLAQPQHETHQNTYVDGGTAAYGRNEFRTGTVASEGPLMTDPQPYRQNVDPHAYRQPMDPQGYRQGPDQQMYSQVLPDAQAYRQQPVAPHEQDVNGARAVGPGPRSTSIDYFDHYKRPPSRDGSVDRYGRRSRQPSVEATAPSGGSRAGSVSQQPPMPSSRPASRAATPAAGNGHLASGRGSITRASSREHQPFEESLLRKRNLGQDISPSPYQPKRTESLFVAQNPAPPPPAPMGGGGGGGGGRKVSPLLYFHNYE